MSGAWGVVIDGVAKITYCHRDAGSSLGVLVAGLIREPDILERARALRVVNVELDAGPEDIERYRHYADLSVGSGRIADWYCLIRRLQHDPAEALRAGVIWDASRFPEDGAQCEWCYLLDLDQAAFEVYRGEQEKPHDRGRFASAPPSGDPRHPCYPCALVLSYPCALVLRRELIRELDLMDVGERVSGR